MHNQIVDIMFWCLHDTHHLDCFRQGDRRFLLWRQYRLIRIIQMNCLYRWSSQLSIIAHQRIGTLNLSAISHHQWMWMSYLIYFFFIKYFRFVITILLLAKYPLLRRPINQNGSIFTVCYSGHSLLSCSSEECILTGHKETIRFIA